MIAAKEREEQEQRLADLERKVSRCLPARLAAMDLYNMS